MTSPSWTDWFVEHASDFTGEFLRNEPLSKHTYYKIGGPTPLLLVPRSKADLQWIKKGISATNCPFRIIGMGSNLLIADAGVAALIIKISKIDLGISESVSGLIRAGASVSVSTLLRKAQLNGWAGLEFMTGIPGSLGGVVFMNAGTHLGEAKDALVEVSAFDLTADDSEKTFTAGELKFEYRKNHFLNPSTVVLETVWKVRKESPEKVTALIQETLVRRKSTQPLDFPSCGSVFKNPPGKRAWEVLDQLGLRGHQIGQAQFSEKHPNFIVNLKGASAQDVLALIQLAKQRALQDMGIPLQEEVKYLS